MKKAVCTRLNIAGSHLRFYKPALFREKAAHGIHHRLHMQDAGTACVGRLSFALPVLRPRKQGTGVRAGLRGRLAFLPYLKLILRFQLPENGSLLPP